MFGRNERALELLRSCLVSSSSSSESLLAKAKLNEGWGQLPARNPISHTLHNIIITYFSARKSFLHNDAADDATIRNAL